MQIRSESCAARRFKGGEALQGRRAASESCIDVHCDGATNEENDIDVAEEEENDIAIHFLTINKGAEVSLRGGDGPSYKFQCRHRYYLKQLSTQAFS